MLKSFRNKTHLVEQDQSDIQKQIADKIDALVDDWATNLKNEIITGAEQYSAGRTIWDRFKNFVSDVYHGPANVKNPYYSINTLGYLGTKANESITLSDYKKLKELCEEVEKNVSQKGGYGSKLLIIRMIDIYASKLKEYLKDTFAPLLASVHSHQHKEEKPSIDITPETPVEQPVAPSEKPADIKDAETNLPEKKESKPRKIEPSEDEGDNDEQKRSLKAGSRSAESHPEFDNIDIIFHSLDHLEDSGDRSLIKDLKFIKTKVDLMRLINETKPRFITSETYKTKNDKRIFVQKYYFDLAKGLFNLGEKYYLSNKSDVLRHNITKKFRDWLFENFADKNYDINRNQKLDKFENAKDFMSKGYNDDFPIISQVYEIGEYNIPLNIFELVVLELLINIANNNLKETDKDEFINKINSAKDLNDIRDLTEEITTKIHSLESVVLIKAKNLISEFHKLCRS